MKQGKCYFTRGELLMELAFAGILAALFLPFLNAPREKAKEAEMDTYLK